MLPYGCKIEIAPNLYVGTVGADSISARGVWRWCKTARAHTVRPYTATKRPPCVKGDSPQCGEMSRSDRGARARRAPPVGGGGL